MPKRNGKSKISLINKQKALIVSRLMQISLRVDDYVYKNIPISSENAELYLKEVTGYKDMCLKDTRSLQVIEKLIQCMHGIIKEQNELQDTDVHVTLDKHENISSSPVDEDLTQLPQEIKESQVITNQTEIYKEDIEHFYYATNLTEAGNKHIKVMNQNREIYNLHRAISELTIQDDTILNANNNLEQSSQSILVNLNTDYVNHQYKANEDIVKNTIISEAINVSRPHIKPAGTKNTQRRKLLNVSALVNNAANTQTEFAQNTDYNTNTDPSKPKNKRKVRKISRKINKDKNEQNKQNKRRKKADESKKMAVKTEKKNNKTKNKQDITKKTLNEMIKYHKNNAATTEFNEMVQNKKNTVKDTLWNIPTNNHNASVPYPNNTFTGKPIVDKDVENDLAWINNLRYVREISKEEILPTYYEDNFWNDYTLPNDWSEHEFL